MRLWNVARTAEEIRESMNRHLIGNEPGLVGYWRFDEGTGEIAFDSSNNGNNGTLIGNPIWTDGVSLCIKPPSDSVAWWGADNNPLDLMGINYGTLMFNTSYAPGKVSQAFSFDGVSDYINVGNDSSITNVAPSALTVETWVYNTLPIQKPDLPDNDLRTILEQRESSGNGGYGLEYGYEQGSSSSGYLVTLYFPNGYQAIADYEILPNYWYHIAGVFDNFLGTIYINGQAQATMTVSSGYTSSTDDVMIGRSGNFGPPFKFHSGLIDEAAVYNRALSSVEIMSIYNAGSGGKCRSCSAQPSGMISWWKGEQNVMDSIGKNNGKLMGGVSYASGESGIGFLFDGGSS